ncbi:MAG: hypothetical protein ACJATV_000343 [Granulosicoccus sp.]|jgi:hypothetical protein
MSRYYVLRHTIIVSLCLLTLTLTGCVHTPSTTEAVEKDVAFHQESTLYFSNKTASISMRASFTNISSNEADRALNKPLIVQPLAEGYKLQFRTINKDNLLINQASIIVGGRKILVAKGAFFVPYNKGVTLSLSLEDTQYIRQHDNAILGINYDKESLLITIKNHKISTFKVK